MKYISLLLFSTILIMFAYPNDSMFTIGSSGIQCIDKNASPIYLQKENLYISFQRKTYSVKVQYQFFNPNEQIDTKIGFPIKIFSRNHEIRDINNYINKFATTVNGDAVSFYVEQGKLNIDKTRIPNTDSSIEYWYIKDVTFTANSKTSITVEYQSKYSGGGMGSRIAYYYYGSGNTWKKGIEELNVSLTTDDDNIIRRINAPFLKNDYQHIWTAENIQSFTVSNLQPDSDDTLVIDVTDFPKLNYVDKFFDDDKRFIGWIDYTLLTNKQLRLIRNTFYAKHNYKFKSENLIAFYKILIKDYIPKHDNVDTLIGPFQKQQLIEIMNEENKRK